MKSLKQIFVEQFNVKITKSHFTQLANHTLAYELRPGHTEALNGTLLGVHNMFFFDKDKYAIFDLFDIDRVEFVQILKDHPDIINDHTVTSDPYNVLTTWLIHLVRVSGMSKSHKHDMEFNLLKLMHYKFFTSTVNNSFKHKANADIMQYTVDNLSGMFGIKKKETPSWRLLIESKCLYIMSHKSIHNRVINNFSPIPVDKEGILYVISNAQTGLRTMVVRIAQVYYANHEENKRIGSYAMVSEIDGDKIIKSLTSNYDLIIENIANACLNENKLIDHSTIHIVATLTKNVREDHLRALLGKFSAMALQQKRSKKDTLVVGEGEHTMLIGYRAIIDGIIQKTYREVLVDKKVNIKSKLVILERVKNMYTSSRISNESIGVVKQSVEKFVVDHSNSRRTSTNSSLKIAFITYFMILSFKSL